MKLYALYHFNSIATIIYTIFFSCKYQIQKVLLLPFYTIELMPTLQKWKNKAKKDKIINISDLT